MPQKRKRRYKIKINSSNKSELEKFFDEHYDYTVPELACKYRIPVSTLRYWLRKINRKRLTYHTKKLLKIRPKYKPIEYPKYPPEVWDKASWFREMYLEKKFGTHILSKMTGLSAMTMLKRLKKYNIPSRDIEESFLSKNSYFDEQWLWDNYVKEGKSLTKLAKEANVSPYTISNWLVHFNLLPRTNNEAGMLIGKKRKIAKYRGTSIQKTNRKFKKSFFGRKN